MTDTQEFLIQNLKAGMDMILGQRPARKAKPTIGFEYAFWWHDGSFTVGVTSEYEIEADGTVYVEIVKALAGPGDVNVLHVLAEDRLTELERKAKSLVESGRR